MKIGLIREGKVPTDKRVVFTPTQVQEIHQRFPSIKITCQSSEHRCYADSEYSTLGIEVKEDVSDCDILMGIKEVPIAELVQDKTYFFFSHTTKKQPYNQPLLKAVIDKRIRLIDYEALKDKLGNRLVAFGRYAGIVGAYNALWTFGKRYDIYSLRRARECFDVNDLKLELRNVKLPPIKIVLTGAGRVAKGAMETLDSAGIRKVNPQDFSSRTYTEPVYVQLGSIDYHTRIGGGAFNRDEFHLQAEKYTSSFLKFAKDADILIAGAFWNPKAPILFSEADMKKSDFRIKIVADITCDINGSVPCTKRACTIDQPLFDYERETGTLHPPFSHDENITVMAVDNLPCELPRSASEEFGQDFINKVIPVLLHGDDDEVIKRATITHNGKLTSNFSYLTDYLNASK